MAFVFRQGDLPKLDLQVDRGTDFKAWKSQWEAYINLSGLITQDAAKQVQALTLCFSRETVTIIDNLGLTAAQRGKVEDIVVAMEHYVNGQINESVERRTFRRRIQQPGESFDDFLVSLRELAKTCNFCDDRCTQKNIRDQIINGYIEGDTVEDLLAEKDLTLEKTVTKCRAQEAAKRQRAEMAGTGGAAIQAIRRYQTPTYRQQNPTYNQVGKTCQGCGASPHQGGRRQCPAFNATCHTCNKVGHLAQVCRGRRAVRGAEPAARGVYTDPQGDEPPPQIHASRAFEPAPTISIHMSSLNGQSMVKVLPDSGADISVAGRDLLEHLHELPGNLLPSNVTPRAVNGTKMHPLGKIPVTLSLGAHQYTDDVYIYPEVAGTLISWKAAKGLKILPDSYPNPPSPSPPQVAITDVSTPDHPTIDHPTGIMSEYPHVFDGNVKTMEGEKFHIALTDDAKPFCVHTPRTIPFAYRDKLQKELQLLQSQGIIEPVTEPTEWCAPIVVAPKKDSDQIRMCVDLSRLNRYVKRERYQSPTPAEAVADIAAENAKVFTKLDALKGYHQCPLDEESQKLTTFITPFGRFKYLRAPFGISSIAEHYNRRMDEAFAGLGGYRRIVDDAVIYDSNERDHTDHVRQFLQRCMEKKITLNTDKWRFAQASVGFAGFTLSADGYRIDQSITEAISSFPTPASRTDLRSFFGLANQLSASTATVAELLAPLRPLLSTKNDFTWSPVLDQAFVTAKKSITSAPTLAFFDLRKPTRLCTDASRQGLGFVLQQKSGESWVLIQAGSRFLSDTESRYAVIELELLAVSWAILKCRIFLAGLPHFSVVTDHYPLISILNNYRLDEIENPRLQRLKTKVMAFNFTAEWIKGTLNNAPDALSRNPVTNPKPHDLLAEQDPSGKPEATIAEIRVTSSGQQESVRLQYLRQITEQDHEYQQLLHYIRNGFPDHRSQLPDGCKRYWNIRSQLALDEDLIVYGCRLLIPVKMRSKVLTQLHESHQGSIRTKQRARLVVYWPGMDNDIDEVILKCKQCQEKLPSQPREPIISKTRPNRPFQEIAADFCSYAANDFLILVDCYSDWPDIIHMGHNTTTPQLITALKKSFCRSGAPDIVWSDQGPQFTSKLFQDFSKEWGFQHVTSSPTYPQSNGKIEATVKPMKKLIESSWSGRRLDEGKLAQALLQYRNTPSRRDGLSPAQKLFGHPMQDALPAHHRAFAPEWQRSAAEVDQQTTSHMEQVTQYYNQHAHTLPHVAIQNDTTKRWDIYGVITEIGPHRRYYVKTTSGRVLTRNRRFLRRRVPWSPPPTSRPEDRSTRTGDRSTRPGDRSTRPRDRSTRPRDRSTPPAPPPAQRSSQRCHNKPKRLIEEITFK